MKLEKVAPVAELLSSIAVVITEGQVGNVLAAMLRTREFVFLQYQNGAIDEATLRSYLAPMPRWLRFPAIQPVLQEFRLEMDQDYLAYLDAMLAESSARD